MVFLIPLGFSILSIWHFWQAVRWWCLARRMESGPGCNYVRLAQADLMAEIYERRAAWLLIIAAGCMALFLVARGWA